MDLKRAKILVLAIGLISAGAILRLTVNLPAAAQAQKPAALAYEASREITVEGTVAEVFNHTGPGKLLGLHLLLNTGTEHLDVHLGPARPSDKPDGIGLVPGDEVEITGLPVSLNDGPVLFARIVKTPNRILVLRSVHGIPLAASGAKTSQSPRAIRGGRQ